MVAPSTGNGKRLYKGQNKCSHHLLLPRYSWQDHIPIRALPENEPPLPYVQPVAMNGSMHLTARPYVLI